MRRARMFLAAIGLLLLMGFESVPQELPRDRRGKQWLWEDTLWTTDTTIVIQFFRGKPLKPGRYWVQVQAVGADGQVSARSEKVYVDIFPETSGKKDFEQWIAPGVGISDILPNPASDGAMFFLDLEEPQRLRVDLFNVAGQMVQENAAGGFFGKGQWPVFLPVREFPAGIYFVRIDAGKARLVRKLVIVR